MAKHRASFGSFCQSRLCSSARPSTPCSLPRPLPRLRSAPEIDSASLRSHLAMYETNVFFWPFRPKNEHLNTQRKEHMTNQTPTIADGLRPVKACLMRL